MTDDGGVWRTISGRKIFIKDGQSVSDAMKRSGKFKGKISDTKKKTKLDRQTEESDEDYAKRKLKEAGDDPIMKRAAERKLKEAEEKKYNNGRTEKTYNSKKQKNEYNNKNEAIKAAYEKQQNNKNTTYEVFEKDGKYYVDGGTNESGKFSWLNTSRWYRDHGYNKLPDSDYKNWMKTNKEKK